MEFKAEIKKTFTGPDKLRAVCSVILDDCCLVKNVRVVEGEKGLFVSLPSRRNVKGEWVEHCFPMTKELREKLSAVVLAEYDRALAAEDGGGEGEPALPEAPAAGTALLLYGVPLYASATAQTRSATVSGRYWVYDGIAVDGRLRITNSASRVERTPIAQNVTGYIDLADAKPEEA